MTTEKDDGNATNESKAIDAYAQQIEAATDRLVELAGEPAETSEETSALLYSAVEQAVSSDELPEPPVPPEDGNEAREAYVVIEKSDALAMMSVEPAAES